VDKMADITGLIAAIFVMVTCVIHVVATRNHKEVDIKRFRVMAATAFAMALLYLVK